MGREQDSVLQLSLGGVGGTPEQQRVSHTRSLLGSLPPVSASQTPRQSTAVHSLGTQAELGHLQPGAPVALTSHDRTMVSLRRDSLF